jgi:hypothetical protein
MSATNSSTARLRAALAYGAANADRTSADRAGRDSAPVTRTKVGVAAQTVRRNAAVRARRMSDGTAESAGWCTAVLASTTARNRSRCRSAQPSEIGPPQSCPTDTTGPVTPNASVTVVRSATRWARVRGPSGRSEYPMPSWSTAITRHPAGASVRKRRHR